MTEQIYKVVLIHPEGQHDGALFEVLGRPTLVSIIGDDVEPISHEEAANVVAAGRDLYLLHSQTSPCRLVYTYVTLHDLMHVA